MLYGNLALDGCIVRTAGVDESLLKFKGRARIFESQEDAVDGILGDQIIQGDVVIIGGEAFPKKIGAQRKALLGRIHLHGL